MTPYNVPSRPQSPSPAGKIGSFHGAHNFGITNSTFIDMHSGSSDTKKLDELKVVLKKTIIEGATYDELHRERITQFKLLEVPDEIQDFYKNQEASKEYRFLTTWNKDVLSQSGIPIVRFFNEAAIPGIRMVAHILFYEIPISGKADIIPTRPNVSRRWVTTLAYQLMVNIPEIQTSS
ncbi:hypothetical protein BDQ17DRAFT_1431476 [Cyathus striatus]|nr:hypothetical protein BDQ17DRAFT_1431476 [Cyathus striatus]